MMIKYEKFNLIFGILLIAFVSVVSADVGFDPPVKISCWWSSRQSLGGGKRLRLSELPPPMPATRAGR